MQKPNTHGSEVVMDRIKKIIEEETKDSMPLDGFGKMTPLYDSKKEPSLEFLIEVKKA